MDFIDKSLIITSRVYGRGNVFVLSVCLSVRVVDTETSFLVWWNILIIPRLSLKIKVTGHTDYQ